MILWTCKSLIQFFCQCFFFCSCLKKYAWKYILMYVTITKYVPNSVDLFLTSKVHLLESEISQLLIWSYLWSSGYYEINKIAFDTQQIRLHFIPHFYTSRQIRSFTWCHFLIKANKLNYITFLPRQLTKPRLCLFANDFVINFRPIPWRIAFQCL